MYGSAWNIGFVRTRLRSIFNNETGSECRQIQCYTRRHALIVLLLLVQSPTVSVLVVHIRCTLQNSSPSGRAAIMRLTLIVGNAGTTIQLCAMRLIQLYHSELPVHTFQCRNYGRAGGAVAPPTFEEPEA